jgi:hypothetical protein
MVSKRKRNRLITRRKGVWGESIPDMWIDEHGIEWLLGSNADLARRLPLSPSEFVASADALVDQGLLEQRTFTIRGRKRIGWRIKFAALDFKLAMLHE